jgi:hypothetical protein
MKYESFTRWSLMALLVLAVLIAFGSVVAGLTFAPLLFRAERPFAIAMWAATVLFPLFLLALLAMPRGSKRLYPLAAISWLFAATWMVINLVWVPSSAGGPWGW